MGQGTELSKFDAASGDSTSRHFLTVISLDLSHHFFQFVQLRGSYIWGHVLFQLHGQLSGSGQCAHALLAMGAACQLTGILRKAEKVMVQL